MGPDVCPSAGATFLSDDVGYGASESSMGGIGGVSQSLSPSFPPLNALRVEANQFVYLYSFSIRSLWYYIRFIDAAYWTTYYFSCIHHEKKTFVTYYVCSISVSQPIITNIIFIVVFIVLIIAIGFIVIVVTIPCIGSIFLSYI